MIRLIQEISLKCLHLTGGFQGCAIERCQSNFIGLQRLTLVAMPDKTENSLPRCHLRLVGRWYSWVGYWMMSDIFYHPRPTPLPWQQRQIAHHRYLRNALTGDSQGQAIQWCQSNFKRSDPGCHGNKIWDKIGCNSVCKTANINVKKLTSLKLIVRTMRWYHSTKTAKIFWVTLDVAMHGAAYGRPMQLWH